MLYSSMSFCCHNVIKMDDEKALMLLVKHIVLIYKQVPLMSMEFEDYKTVIELK